MHNLACSGGWEGPRVESCCGHFGQEGSARNFKEGGPEHDPKRLPWYCAWRRVLLTMDWSCGAPPLRIMKMCFGQMGKVGRSSRATIVNETLDSGLPVAPVAALAAVVEDIASAPAVIAGRFPATVVTLCGLALLSLLLVVPRDTRLRNEVINGLEALAEDSRHSPLLGG